MPFRQNIASHAQTNAVSTNAHDFEIDAGTSNNRGIIFGFTQWTGASSAVTNVSWQVSNSMTRLFQAGGTNSSNSVVLDIWTAYGVDANTNSIQMEMSTSFADWAVLMVSYTDVATNGTPVDDQSTQEQSDTDVTNTISSTNTRIALSYWSAAAALAGRTINGSTGHTSLTNFLWDNDIRRFELSTVSNASNSTQMGFTWGSANDSTLISFDVQGPPGVTNVAMVGIG